MPSKFVPLLPTAPASTGPARTLDSASVSASFVAMKNPGSPSPTPQSPAPSACAHNTGNPGAKPVVTLQRDGDRVTHVRVQCACGEIIELECSY